jgi:hypothetical protein
MTRRWRAALNRSTTRLVKIRRRQAMDQMYVENGIELGALHLVHAFMRVRAQIKQQQAMTAQLRVEENRLMMSLRDYMNQNGATSINIDDSTCITLGTVDKRVVRKAKSIRPYIAELLAGHELVDDRLLDEILAAKTENIIQEQKLKIVKLKRAPT